MRVAALGYDPGFPGIEAVGFGSAHPLERYDALIFSPAGLVDEYRDLYTRPGSEAAGPLLSLAASTRLLADSRRRRAEFARLIERGGVLVVDPWAGPHLRVHAIEDIMAFEPEETLPRHLRGGMFAADAGEIAEFRGGQPFRAFVDRAGAALPARCALESFSGVPLFFGARTGAILGGYRYCHPGHLLFLPRPRAEQHDASERWHRALLPLTESLAQQNAVFDLADWSRDFALPGEAEARQTLRELLSKHERLEREIEDARETLGNLDRQKTLFAGAGHALAAGVAYAFERSGALVLPDLFGPGNLVLEYRSQFAVVLIADRENESDAAARLRRLLDTFEESFGENARGIVVHGRGLPPDRGGLADENLRRRLERNGHRYLTGWELFEGMFRSTSPEEALRRLFAGRE